MYKAVQDDLDAFDFKMVILRALWVRCSMLTTFHTQKKSDVFKNLNQVVSIQTIISLIC